MAPLSIIAAARRRAAFAWRALREGPPAAGNRPVAGPRVAGRGVTADGSTVDRTIAELRGYVAPCFAGVGLPPDWPCSATSEELRQLKVTADLASGLRHLDWDRIEAGTWPS